MKRGKPLQNKTQMNRSGPIKAKPGAARAKEKRNAARAKLVDGMAVPFDPREIDEDYLAWIRKQKCVLTGCTTHEGCHPMYRVDPAHSGSTVGAHGSDYDVIPLIHKRHMEQHSIGFKRFEMLLGICYKSIIKKLNQRYENETSRTISRK